MRAVFYTVSLVIGCCCGTMSFIAAYSLVEWEARLTSPHETRIYPASEYRHSGTVVTHDTSRKTITIRQPSAFETGTSTKDMRFTFDGETEWSSIEYLFRDSILERRIVTEHERERPLPEGTLVWLVRDPTVESPWRLAHLAFLRRTDL